MKKKALPMWIREGLEKLEKKKQKKDQGDDNDPKKSSVNLSASGSSSIAGYDHGKVHSPVRSPKNNDSDEVSEHAFHIHFDKIALYNPICTGGVIWNKILMPCT